MSALELSVAPEVSVASEAPLSPTPLLSLKDLHGALTARGVEIAYSSLSEMISGGDMAEQLNASGSRSRRQFHPDVADILAAFLAEFRQASGKASQAPGMFRSFALRRMSHEGRAMVPSSGSLVPSSMNPETPKQADPVQLAAAQGRAQGLAAAEKVLTAKEAAEMLGISPATLRKTVPPYRRFGTSARGDRWLLSDLLSR